VKVFTEYGGFRVWSAALVSLRGAVSSVAARSFSGDIYAQGENAEMPAAVRTAAATPAVIAAGTD